VHPLDNNQERRRIDQFLILDSQFLIRKHDFGVPNAIEELRIVKLGIENYQIEN